MGPQRKQEMLDDARNASPEVATAYDAVMAAKETVPLKGSTSHGIAFQYSVSHTVQVARLALKTALQDYGMNRFDARVLSEFVVADATIVR